MEQNQFKVIYTGQLQEGHDATTVTELFAKRFKIAPEKAKKIIAAKRDITIKAHAEHVKAYQLKAMLESFGMVVRLERAAIEIAKTKKDTSTPAQTDQKKVQTHPANSWSLEPIEQAKPEDEVDQSEPEQNEPEKATYTDLSRPTVVLEKKQPEITEKASAKTVETTHNVPDSKNAVLSLVKSIGGWVLAGLGVLFVLVKKVGIFKIFKVGGLMTVAAFAGYQPDEICMGNDRCESAVEDQIDDCWDFAGLDDYDLDHMSDEEYMQLKPKIEEEFIACFRYEDTAERVFQSPLELHLDLIDNCTFSDQPKCESLTDSQFKACYDRHQIGYLVSARTTDFYQQVSDHASVFKSYYGCFKDDSGQALFKDLLNGWDEIY